MYALIVDVGENSYVEHMADVDTMDQWEQRLNRKFPRLKFMRSVVVSLNHPTNDEVSIVSNYEVLEAENNRLELEANGAEK
jgi:predicted GTPase